MCWSTKNKMVASRAGMMAAGGAQEGRPLPMQGKTDVTCHSHAIPLMLGDKLIAFSLTKRIDEERSTVGISEETFIKNIVDNQLWCVDLGQYVHHHPHQHGDEHSKVTYQLTNLKKDSNNNIYN